MRHAWLGIVAIALIVVGAAGFAVTAAVTGASDSRTVSPGPADGDVGPYVVPGPRGPMGRQFPRYSEEGETSLGARIYLDGLGADGRAVPRTAIGPGMMGGGCVTCHDVDGQGGSFRAMGRAYETPAITYETLTSEHEHGESGWTDAEIRRALEDGVEPDGDELDPLMPRWDFTDEEFEALLDYLKELDTR